MNYKKLVLNKCHYFNMRMICEKSGINYSTYRGWKNGGRAFSEEKAKAIYHTMINIMKEKHS